MEFTITSDQILWVCGFIGAVWGVVKIYKELKKPNEDKEKMLLEHERKLSNDNERLQEIESTNNLILRSLLVIINHDITGNGIDQLKETRDDIQEFLINK